MSGLATFVRSVAGDSQGTFLFYDAVGVNTATSITSGRPGVISAYQPWTHATTKTILDLHPAAIWSELVVRVVPGPGVFGRAVVLHCGWGHDGDAAPTTIAGMTQLSGYSGHTYGGAADPGEADRTFRAIFNEGRSDVLKMRYWPVGGRVVFYYCFTEAKFGVTQVDGDRFTLNFSGQFEVLGRN